MESSDNDATAGRTVTVFAAASLTDLFEAAGRRFEAEHEGFDVRFAFAGSQQLASQIQDGAPADLFASADYRQMQAAIESGEIAEEEIERMAYNSLTVMLAPKVGTDVDGSQSLVSEGLQLAVAAQEVPAGAYTDELLDALPYGDELRGRIVSYEQNVRAVVTKVLLGEVDAGIVYASDMIAVVKNGRASVRQLEIPETVNHRAAYWVAPLQAAPNRAAAERYIDFLLSDAVAPLFVEYGFVPVRRGGNES